MNDVDIFPLILHGYQHFSLIYPDEYVPRCNLSIFHLHVEDTKLGQKGDIEIITEDRGHRKTREERGHINNYRRKGTYKF